MASITYEAEYKKELKSVETWFYQISHIFKILLNVIAYAITYGTLATIVIFSIMFIYADNVNQYTLLDIQIVFKLIFTFACLISFFASIIYFISKRFQNIFKLIAQDRVDRYQGIKNDYDHSVLITEDVLIKYNLIKTSDIRNYKRYRKH